MKHATVARALNRITNSEGMKNRPTASALNTREMSMVNFTDRQSSSKIVYRDADTCKKKNQNQTKNYGEKFVNKHGN